MSWYRYISLVLLSALATVEGSIIQRNDNLQHDQRWLQESEPKKDTSVNLLDSGYMAINDFCSDAHYIQAGDVIDGNTEFATEDSRTTGDCVNSSFSGVWYSTNGTGDWLRANIQHTNHTDVAIFIGDDCDALTCLSSANGPKLAISNLRTSAGVTTDWATEKDKHYFIYVYGAGDFQLTITKYARPENDHLEGATELRIGNSLVGETDFATSDPNITVCESTDESSAAGGVWYTINGTGNFLQAHVKTEKALINSKVSIYTTALDCVANIETIQYYDNQDYLDWYPISNGYIWDSTEGEMYFILVQGEDAGGSFEITISEDERPVNDDCSGATLLEIGNTHQGMTKFANIDDITICNAHGTEGKPLAPGVWYKISNLEGAYKASVTSDYLSQLSVFSGSSCDELVCIEGSHDSSPDTITHNSAPSSSVAWNATNGETYYILVHGSESLVGDFNIIVTLADDTTAQFENGSPATEESTVQRVDAKGQLIFGFFPYTTVREPTQQEAEALVDQTIAFFTIEFGNKYDNFVRFGALETSVVVDDEDRLPVTISLDFHVFFSIPKNDDNNGAELITSHTPEEILDTMSEIDLSGYIQNFVWESKPFSKNLFYETMQVIFRPNESGDMEETTAPSEALVSQLDNKALVHVAVSYSFHHSDATTMRAPVATEIAGLMNQTNLFFSELLQNELPESAGFSKLSIVVDSVDYKQDSEFSVVVYAEIQLSFTEDSNVEDRATTEEILALLETADMAEYVEYYAWFAEPVGSIFFSTFQTVLEPYTPVALDTPESTETEAPTTQNNSQVTEITTTTDGTPATLVRVESDATLLFDFFLGTDIKNGASQDELDSLTAQTKDFFTKVLKEAFSDMVRLDVHLITAGYAENNSILPTTVVTWKLEALFDLSQDQDNAERNPEQLLEALRASDIEDYLHNHVWNSSPIGHNFFFSTEAVRFEYSSDGTLAVERTLAPNTTTTSTTTSIPNKDVLIQVNLSYGFLPDQIIDEEPSGVELQGVLFQTSLFFNKLFRDSFTTDIFERCETGLKSVDLVTNAELPISIFYELKLTFHESSNGSDGTIPTVQNIAQTMENANFEDYIVLYIWNADANSGSPDSIFYDTQQVLFQAMV